MSEGRWVTLENDTKLFIGSGRTFRQALQDRLNYTESPNKDLQEGLQDRFRDNEYNEIKDKIENISKRADFIKVLKEDLGLEKVNVSGFDNDTLKEVAYAINDNIYEFPETKGVLKEVRTSNQKRSGAAASVTMTMTHESEEPFAFLTINKHILSDYERASEKLSNSHKQNWFSSDKGVQGLIKHEMGHVLEYHHYIEKSKGKYDFTTEKGKVDFLINGKNDKSTTELVNQAFKNVGIEKNRENLEKYISKYGSTSDSETFAEAWSSTKDNKVVKEIQKLIKERRK